MTEHEDLGVALGYSEVRKPMTGHIRDVLPGWSGRSLRLKMKLKSRKIEDRRKKNWYHYFLFTSKRTEYCFVFLNIVFFLYSLYTVSIDPKLCNDIWPGNKNDLAIHNPGRLEVRIGVAGQRVICHYFTALIVHRVKLAMFSRARLDWKLVLESLKRLSLGPNVIIQYQMCQPCRKIVQKLATIN